MDQYGPDIDKGEKEDVCKFLQRKEERKQMIGYTLRKSIQRVERMAGKGGRHDPLVMRLVQRSVHQRIVKATMDPINA